MFTVMSSAGFAIRAGWRCAWTSTPTKESFPLFRWESWRLRDLCLLYSCGKHQACPVLSGEHKTASHSLTHHTPMMLEIPFGRLNYEALDAGSSSWFRVLRARANPCADLVKLTTEGILTKPLWPMSPPLWELGCGTEVNLREILVAQLHMGCREGSRGTSRVLRLSPREQAATGGAQARSGSPVTFSCIQSTGGGITRSAILLPPLDPHL